MRQDQRGKTLPRRVQLHVGPQLPCLPRTPTRNPCMPERMRNFALLASAFPTPLHNRWTKIQRAHSMLGFAQPRLPSSVCPCICVRLRSMSEFPNYMTPEGFERLRAEHAHLCKRERPRVVQEVAEAAAQGDRSENAEYIYGKKRLREIDRRVRFLEQRLDAAQVVDPRMQTRRDKIFFAAMVTVEDEKGETKLWKIVGEDETDAALGHISHRSPIGQALLGKGLDDEIKVRTPVGERILTVVEIRYE